jgi:WD40 repeat protein
VLALNGDSRAAASLSQANIVQMHFGAGDLVGVLSAGGGISLWRTNGSSISAISAPQTTADFRFDPTGEHLLTFGGTGALLWDLKTGEPPVPVDDPGAGAVIDAEFSPDGQFLLTVSRDGKLRMWAGATLRHTFAGPVPSARGGFSLNGRYLLSTNRDGGGEIWGLDGDPILRFAAQTRAPVPPYLTQRGDVLVVDGSVVAVHRMPALAPSEDDLRGLAKRIGVPFATPAQSRLEGDAR